MLKFIPLRVASNGMIILFSMIIIFHGLAIFGIVPYQILWGGRLKNHHEMLVFETVSMVINGLMLVVVMIHKGVINKVISDKAVKIALWVMFLLFVINTIGNINAVSSWERYIFTPITLILALFCLRLAKV